MKKRLLSIITSASILASAFSFGASALPSAVENMDTGFEYVPEIFEEHIEAELTSSGPKFVDIMESASETNSVFGKPDAIEGAFLMSDLSGEGTEESPYLIDSADDLKLMAHNINNGINTNAYYKLTSDISLGGSEWTPIGYVTGKEPNTNYTKAFKGHFDGDGHTVSDFVITKDSTAYIGFFGFIYNGTVENLTIDNATINFASSYTETLHVSPLAGRVIVNTDDARANIISCSVKNSSVKVTSVGTVYAGGLFGTGVASGENANIFVAFADVECDISVESTANLAGHLASAGGLAGYYGSLTGATITAINCHVSGNVHASALKSEYANVLSGGLFGNLRSYEPRENGGSIRIDSCYSEGTVVGESDFQPYIAGGFSAQFLPTENSYITNCYSSADTSGRHLQKGHPYYPNNDPVAGGFIGMLDFPGFSSDMGNKIFNCYASGDAVDLTHTTSDLRDTSFVGGFVGYSTAGIFENCFKLESQKVWGSDVFTYDCATLSEEDVKYQDKFTGFDFKNTWDFNPDAEYPYPTLQEKKGYAEFIVDGVSFATTVFGNNGKVIVPSEKPEREPTVDKVFEFIYWSLTEDGDVFNFGSETVSENTVFHAVFSSSPRPYKVKFVCEGQNFIPEQTLVYGTPLTCPEEIPFKEDNEIYFYEFSHWSAIYDGVAFDFTDAIVDGEITLYAVFTEFEKSAWRGEIADSFASGYGTETSPYIIRNSEQFALLAKLINEGVEGYADAYYALGNDVNLGGNVWTPIGKSESIPFSANFDGRGYMIRNFIITDSQYTGLFGYVLNATIKNIHVSDFEVILSTDRDDDFYMYAGGLAGYVTAKNGYTSVISGIRVSDFDCDIDINVYHFYFGCVAGYAHADSKSSVYIFDSFSEGDISSVNTGGYAHLGGIAGYCKIGSRSDFKIFTCYSAGTITSVSYNSTYAGGIAGRLLSLDSGALPEIGLGSENADAELSADDPKDIMIERSFAATSISAETSAPFSNGYIGYLVGDNNTYSDIDKNTVFYPRGIGLTLNPSSGDSKLGSSTANSNLMSANYLSANLGFDFNNTWMFISGHDYPVLRMMELNKPALRMSASYSDDKVIDVAIQIVSPSDDFTIMIGIYNARNQLIKLERINLTASYEFTDIAKSYENIKNAVRVSVSAVERTTLTPLFESVSAEL